MNLSNECKIKWLLKEGKKEGRKSRRVRTKTIAQLWSENVLRLALIVGPHFRHHTV